MPPLTLLDNGRGLFRLDPESGTLVVAGSGPSEAPEGLVEPLRMPIEDSQPQQAKAVTNRRCRDHHPSLTMGLPGNGRDHGGVPVTHVDTGVPEAVSRVKVVGA